MSKSEGNMNLYQKLIKIRKTVEYLKKDASGHRYKYTKESQVIAALRPAMDEQNVFLEIGMIEPTWHERNIISVGFEFTWINADNPDDRIVKLIYLQDIAGDPKKIGGLLTYATRYHLCKFFQIATDEMDIDKFQEEIMKEKTVGQSRLIDTQLEIIENLINGYEDIRASMLRAYGSLSRIPSSDFEKVVNKINRLIKDKKNTLPDVIQLSEIKSDIYKN